MNTREFLTAIWPDDGPYCIARPFLPKGSAKSVYAQTAYDTMDDVITYVMNRRAHDDIFFAIHTLKVARQLNPDTGKMKVYRTHENMKEARAFFFDLDVGDEAWKYPDQASALAGLERFLFRVPLPRPIITSSGNGLHVYWSVDTPIASDIWRDWADKLHWIAQKHGLKADPSRTTDQSSVLRVANTSNFKDPTKPRKVVVLHDGEQSLTSDFTALLDELCGDEYTPVGYMAPTGVDPNAPFEWDGRLTPVEELVDICAYVRDFRDIGGSVPEPYWHVMVGLIKYADEGQRYAHEWSQGHPTYSQAETQSKIDLWTTKPPSCDKIKTNCGGDKCGTCPVKTMGRNPLDIANKVWSQRAAPAPMLLANTQAQVGNIQTLVNPPYPYERKLSGIIRKLQDDDEPDPSKKKRFVRILDYDMFPIQQFNGIKETTGGFSKWVVTLPLEGQKVFDVPTACFDPRQLHQRLLDEGVIVAGKMITEVRDFMLAYMKTLQKAIQAHKQYDYMGWEVIDNKDEKPPAFILHGKKVITATGEVQPVAMAKTMGGVQEFMCKAGTLEKQVELLDFYNHKNYIPHQFLILSAMGTPYYKFTGQSGVIINLSGDSGVSKSQAVYTAASIYGHPTRYPISGIPGASTRNGREDRSMILANLPFIIDEITLMSPDDARSLVMGDTQPSGGSKQNQDRSIKRMRGGEKSNVMICSANSSLHQLINTSNIAGQAGTVRVFEMHVKKGILVHEKWEADAYMRELRRNYGHVGEEIITQLMPHLDVVEKKIIKEMARLDKILHVEAAERFWIAVCAIVMVIGRLTKLLGFHNYDMNAIEDWLVKTQFPFLRGTVSVELDRHDPVSVVMDYLDSIHGETIRIEPDKNGQVSGILQVPHGDLKAHFDLTAREVWVRCDPFRKHCERDGHPHATIMRELVLRGVVTNSHIRKTIGNGTQYAIGRVFCFVINLRHPDVAPLSVAPPAPEDDDVDPTLSNVIPIRKK